MCLKSVISNIQIFGLSPFILMKQIVIVSHRFFFETEVNTAINFFIVDKFVKNSIFRHSKSRNFRKMINFYNCRHAYSLTDEKFVFQGAVVFDDVSDWIPCELLLLMTSRISKDYVWMTDFQAVKSSRWSCHFRWL